MPGMTVQKVQTTASQYFKVSYVTSERCNAYKVRHLNREDRGSNPLAAVLKHGQFRSLHVAPVHSVV